MRSKRWAAAGRVDISAQRSQVAPRLRLRAAAGRRDRDLRSRQRAGHSRRSSRPRCSILIFGPRGRAWAGLRPLQMLADHHAARRAHRRRSAVRGRCHVHDHVACCPPPGATPAACRPALRCPFCRRASAESLARRHSAVQPVFPASLCVHLLAIWLGRQENGTRTALSTPYVVRFGPAGSCKLRFIYHLISHF